MKKSFLKAIRVELLTLNEHLKGTLKDVAEVRDSLDKKVPKALHLATVFQTGVYTCQLGKLRDVSDPLVLETIRFTINCPIWRESRTTLLQDHLS